MKTRFEVISSRSAGERKQAVLEIRSLKKVFRVNDTFLNVLDDVDFKVAKGEFICIVGRSGCGKSTLLKILAGFLCPSSGEILLQGKQIVKPGPDRCVVFQEDTLFPWLTVEENIAFGLKGRTGSKKAIRKEVERFLSLVDLTPFRDYLPREISGGMKQRVALARVLILKPKVLLMDEPFASLDAQSREDMHRLLLSLWKTFSHTILFVTHDVMEAALLADKILVMDKNPGKIREEFRVNLPRPRQRENRNLISVYQRLYNRLRD